MYSIFQTHMQSVYVTLHAVFLYVFRIFAILLDSV